MLTDCRASGTICASRILIRSAGILHSGLVAIQRDFGPLRSTEFCRTHEHIWGEPQCRAGCWLPVIAVNGSQQLSELHWISDGRMVLRRPRRQGSDQVGSDVALGATGGNRVPEHTSTD